MRLFLSRIASPLGEMLLVTDARFTLHAADFADHRARLNRNMSEHYGISELTEASAPGDVVEAFARYFAGGLDALDALSTAAAGSDLQRRVWAGLRWIPAGTTTTYGKLAKALGFDDPRAAIDMGAANAANPIAIVVPCHRVVGSDGDLKGYAWGVRRKRWLLEHEGAICPRIPRAQTAALPGF